MTRSLLALALGSCAWLVACGSSGSATDKVGPSRDTAVLRLASISGSLQTYPAVALFTDALERRSGGRMKVKLVNRYGDYAENAEQQLVLGVAEHDVDLGYVHAGVFDTFGVTSLQALSAPMLMRSYAVERAVLSGDLGDAMLAGVEETGVVGLALLGDQMRRPFAVERPLLEPGDYRGLAVASYPSRITDAALSALGARQSHLFGGRLMDALDDRSVDGFERTLRIYAGDGMAGLAPYITANVVLWPQVLALIANPDTMRRLSDEQRRWLERAARDAATGSITQAQQQERQNISEACNAGGRFKRATATQIAALRARFADAYALLDADAQTRSFVSRIRALDAATPPDVEIDPPAGCTGRPPAAPQPSAEATRRFEGTWRFVLTKKDRERFPPGYGGQATPGDDIFTVRIDQARWHMHLQASDGTIDDYRGQLALDGDELVVSWDDNSAVDRFGFRHGGDVLRLRAISGDKGDLFVWTAKPWRRIG